MIDLGQEFMRCVRFFRHTGIDRNTVLTVPWLMECKCNLWRLYHVKRQLRIIVEVEK